MRDGGLHVDLEHRLPHHINPVQRGRVFGQEVGNIPCVVHDARNDPGFLEVSDAVGANTSGDENEENAGDCEEHTHVDASCTFVHCPPENDGDNQPEHDARRGGRHVVFDRRPHGGPDEQRGFHAFAADGEDGDPYDAPAGFVFAEGSRHGALEFTFHLAGVLPHPKNHPGDQSYRDKGEASADDLLCLEGECFRSPRQDGAE